MADVRLAHYNHALSRRYQHRRFVAASIGTCAGLLLALGCHHLPPSEPLSQLDPQQLAGYHVFQTRCAECHNANSQRALHGPGLQGIFKVPYLPSGMPANDERVLYTIQHGRGMMPAFGNRLDDQETTALLAYLHTL